jgi:hypothetical protein
MRSSERVVALAGAADANEMNIVPRQRRSAAAIRLRRLVVLPNIVSSPFVLRSPET